MSRHRSPKHQDDDDVWRCPTCGQSIPPKDVDDHEAGADASRLECAHQDIELIKQRSAGAVAPWRKAW